MRLDQLRLCLCCGSLRVWVRRQPDGTELVACRACRSLVRIDPAPPPGEPGISGRVEVLLPPDRETPTH